jgi:hypothetical protein
MVAPPTVALLVKHVGKHEGYGNMSNPLDSLTGTIVLGLIITVVMVYLVNLIGA